MIRDAQWTVRPDEADERLDRLLLRRLATTNRALVLKALAAGAVRVNGRRAAKGVKVQAGDAVAVTELMECADLRVRPDPALSLEVVYADARLLALNKPPGQSVQPLDPQETGTLANALVARYPEVLALGDDPLMPGLLHRIDTDTSGLVLAARDAEAYAALRAQFKAQTVRKEYLALVRGEVAQGGRLEGNLVHEPAFRGRMRPVDYRGVPRGQKPLPAVTDYAPLARSPEASLLLVTIFTGVTHQIRCQLADAGMPILGDRLYGEPEENEPARHMLHAWRVTLRPPGAAEALTLEAPPPDDFQQARSRYVGA